MIAFAIILAIVMLTLVFTLLLKRQLREKYAILWLVIGLAVLVLALFPELLGWMAGLLHVQVASNLLFALALILLVGVCLHLSWELSRSEERMRRTAEELALLRADIDSLQRSQSERETGDQ